MAQASLGFSDVFMFASPALDVWSRRIQRKERVDIKSGAKRVEEDSTSESVEEMAAF